MKLVLLIGSKPINVKVSYDAKNYITCCILLHSNLAIKHI